MTWNQRAILAAVFGWLSSVAIWTPLGAIFNIAPLPLAGAAAVTSFALCQACFTVTGLAKVPLRDYVTGLWTWTITLRCSHPYVRCVHGDEINLAGGRRCMCTRCYRYLQEPLPSICTATGRPHR